MNVPKKRPMKSRKWKLELCVFDEPEDRDYVDRKDIMAMVAGQMPVRPGVTIRVAKTMLAETVEVRKPSSQATVRRELLALREENKKLKAHLSPSSSLVEDDS